MMALQQPAGGRRLAELLAGFADVPPAMDTEVPSVSMDSRALEPGALFLACAGTRSHGSDYLDAAIAAGAGAVALDVEKPSGGFVSESGVPVVPVPGLARSAGEIAARFYGYPSHELEVVGVTGTNGKTSVAYFLAQMLGAGRSCGLIGTLGSGMFGRLQDTGHTTPNPVALQAELAAMRDAGAKHVVMEVSSHGLHQGRVAGIRFAAAVFTNLSRDHLDYHGDMESYAAAKRALFETDGLGAAVLNMDDPSGRAWREALPPGVQSIGYSLEPVPAGKGLLVIGSNLHLQPRGLSFSVQTPWGDAEVRSPLLGRFNACNLLAAIATTGVLGVPLTEAVRLARGLQSPPGRMERFGGDGHRTLAVVDYAHTPDALEQVLGALREHCRGRLWCVFGCGGNRDRGKRPAMGRIAEALADFAIVTDDNPRDEDPWGIAGEILGGMTDPDAAYVVRDRAAAIAHALGLAGPDDVVLIAGKGHERLQCIAGECRPFSDAAEVRRFFGESDG